MPSRSASMDISLSLIDVITNGLGGVLVLFFLLALLQTQVTWRETQGQTSQAAAEKVDPLLILVEGRPGGALFAPGLPWTQAMPPGMETTYGPNFAVLYFPRLPAASERIALNLASSHKGGQVQILHGKQSWSLRIEPGQAGVFAVWPPRLPGSRTP